MVDYDYCDFGKNCTLEHEQNHAVILPGFADGEGTIKDYVSNNLSVGEQQIASQFQEIPLDLRMVHFLVNNGTQIICSLNFWTSKVDNLKATSVDKIPSDLEGMEASMTHLLTVIDDIYKYVDDVVEGRVDPENKNGTCISDVVGSLPPAFDKLVNDSLQDHLLMLYLSSITRTQLSLAEKLNTPAQIL